MSKAKAKARASKKTAKPPKKAKAKKTGAKKRAPKKTAKKAAKKAATKRAAKPRQRPPAAPKIPEEFNPQSVLMKAPSNGGRPTSYDPKMLNRVYRWFYLGYTVPMICRALHICKQTYYNWTREHAEFLDCHNRGRMACQGYYEQAMRLAAIGAVNRYRHHAARAIMHHHYGYNEPEEDGADPDNVPLLVEFGEYIEPEPEVIKEAEAEVVENA